MRKRIGIDFDDVVLDCNTSLALFHNARYGTTFERRYIKTFHLEDLWGCTREEAKLRVSEWYSSPEHASSLPVPGALEAIAELATDYELHVITARSDTALEVVNEWIARHSPNVFTDIHFVHRDRALPQSKAEICKRLGVALHIDDSLDNAESVSAAGIPVILFDTPWNQSEVSGNITRVFSWDEALLCIKSCL